MIADFIELKIADDKKITIRRDQIDMVKPDSDDPSKTYVSAGMNSHYTVSEPYEKFARRLTITYGWDWTHNL